MQSPLQHPSQDVALVSQMRSGTHFMCAALRLTQEGTLMRPKDNGLYGPMPDAEILVDMHRAGRFDLPPPRPGKHIYFSHYYHSHHVGLAPMPRISLIAFPLDSFYSDGVVFSDESYTAGPSGPRAHLRNYVFRYGSPEWRKLEPWMHKNAQWLKDIGKTDGDLVVRYEDLYERFEETAKRIERHVGGFINPMPKPVMNLTRAYWTRDFNSKFDTAALNALNDIFRDGIARFYPECLDQIKTT